MWAVVSYLAHIRRGGETPTGTSRSYKENVHKSVETKGSKKKSEVSKKGALTWRAGQTVRQLSVLAAVAIAAWWTRLRE